MSDAGLSAIARAKAEWRDYNDRLGTGIPDPALHIGIAASFTANPLVPFLGAFLLRDDASPVVTVAPYHPMIHICMQPEDYFSKECGAIILLWRLEDLLYEEILAFLQGDEDGLQKAQEKMALFISALSQLRSHFSGNIIVSIPPYPVQLPQSLSSVNNPDGLGSVHRVLAAGFIEDVRKINGITLFDLDALQRETGLNASHDSRYWYLYRQPFKESFFLAMGRALSRILLAQRRASRKCIVLDCDNTLWGGIVGEDGIEGIHIGEGFPGEAYRDFQRLLLYWRKQGVFLAIASKNNEADIWEVFDKHSGMVLKREHISSWSINWQPKAEGIPHIANELHIGTDSLVFIDDNPMEVAYMRQAYPEIATIQMPQEPADILAVMQSYPYFDRLDITEEDRRRAEMMHVERERQAIFTTLSKEAFIKELDVRTEWFAAQMESAERIAQLINKTNQFNLSTRRRSLDEVKALMASPHYRVYGVRVSDKFGDYGLTGVVILKKEPGRYFIDTLLLSCRVLGRGVETAVFQSIVQEARHDRVKEITASFIPTAKNAPAATFLPDHGFIQQQGDEWNIKL